MRSFSIVLAWFFACLVVIIGEVQELGDIKVCRYRKFGRDFRNIRRLQMSNSQLVNSDPAEQMINDNNKFSGRKGSRTLKTSRQVSQDGAGAYRKPMRGRSTQALKGTFDYTKFKANGLSALNAFYPVTRNLRASSALKYPTSHYEVHLDMGPKILGTAGQVQALEHETNPDDLETTVRLGGELFHSKVMAAAYEANKQFCTNVAQVDIPGLCNAFYLTLFNSRQMYALLLTAMRTQNMINAVDEDGVFLAPIFCNHRMQRLAIPAGNSVPWKSSTYAYLYSSLQVRHTDACFGGVMSNAAWAQMWSTGLTALRLPKRWMKLLEDMFLSVKVVKPDDGSKDPRFVVLWPDGGYERWDLALGQFTHEYVNGYYYKATSTPDIYTGNTDISFLQSAVEDMVATFNILMQTFPQLDIMYHLLDCIPSSNIDITRDITSKTLFLDYSEDIEDFIYSTAVPFYVTSDAAQTYGATYATVLDNRSILPQYWVTMNSDTRSKQSKPQLKELATCAIEYINSREIDVPLHVLFYKHVAPINLSVYELVNNAANPNQDPQYVVFNLSNYWNLSEYIRTVNSTGIVNPHPTMYNMWEQFDAMREYQSFAVQPRDTIRASDITNNTVAAIVTNGMVPVKWHVQGTTSVPEYRFHATSRDFQVPEQVVSQVNNEFLDSLTC